MTQCAVHLPGYMATYINFDADYESQYAEKIPRRRVQSVDSVHSIKRKKGFPGLEGSGRILPLRTSAVQLKIRDNTGSIGLIISTPKDDEDEEPNAYAYEIDPVLHTQPKQCFPSRMYIQSVRRAEPRRDPSLSSWLDEDEDE